MYFMKIFGKNNDKIVLLAKNTFASFIHDFLMESQC